jgi:hypothetical protein
MGLWESGRKTEKPWREIVGVVFFGHDSKIKKSYF